MFGCFSLGCAAHIRKKKYVNNFNSSTKKCYLQLKLKSKILNFKAHKFYPLMVWHSRLKHLHNQSFFSSH